MENVDPFKKFSFISAKNGGKYFFYNGYTYKLNKKTPSTWYLCCTSRCGATMTVFPNFTSIKKFPTNLHSHAPVDPGLEQNQAIMQKFKKAIRKDPTKTVKTIYDDVCAKNANAVPPLFETVKSTLYRTRSEKLPKIPSNPRRFIIPSRWKKTFTKKNFLLKHDKKTGVAVFATDQMVQTLSGCSAILCDGTFKSCPRPFYQLFTIHGLKINRKIPLVWAFSDGKTTEHYRKIFQIVKNKIQQDTGHHWEPAQVISDYERAIISAVETEFPNSTHKGCYFHFTQAVYRTIQKFGLSLCYKNDERMRMFSRYLMSTAFLPHSKVSECILKLCETQMAREVFQEYPALADLLRYFHSTWILTFPPKMWSCFQRENALRTTNSCESWHSQWNRKLSRSRPSFWTTLRLLKKEEVQVKNSISQIERGLLPPAQKKKWRIFNAQLDDLKLSFLAGERNIFEYWAAISHCSVPINR